MEYKVDFNIVDKLSSDFKFWKNGFTLISLNYSFLKNQCDEFCNKIDLVSSFLNKERCTKINHNLKQQESKCIKYLLLSKELNNFILSFDTRLIDFIQNKLTDVLYLSQELINIFLINEDDYEEKKITNKMVLYQKGILFQVIMIY